LVLALIALSVALGGNAIATVARSGGHKIKRGEIARGAVTAKALANGAVTANKLRRESVTGRKIKSGAVGSEQIADSAVTARAIAPSSIYGYALGPVETASAVIKDPDAAADLSTWTNSNIEAATCPAGARLLSGGLTFTNPGNRRVGTITSVPNVNGTNAWLGAITSDSGGLGAEAQVQALCLKAGP